MMWVKKRILLSIAVLVAAATVDMDTDIGDQAGRHQSKQIKTVGVRSVRATVLANSTLIACAEVFAKAQQSKKQECLHNLSQPCEIYYFRVSAWRWRCTNPTRGPRLAMAKRRGTPTWRLDHSNITFAMIVIMNTSIQHAVSFIIGTHTLTSLTRQLQRQKYNRMALLSRSRIRQLSSFASVNSQLSSSTSDYCSLTLRIPTPEDMEDIGGLLSVNTTIGDIILLDGDLGAGKTCFSRGFVRGRTGIPNQRVTSPTFLLSNTYPIDNNDDNDDDDDGRGGALIHHMDLYRLSDSKDDYLAPLNLEHAFANGISLIEWPSRLRWKPTVRLEITLTISNTTLPNEVSSDETRDRFMRLVPYGDRWVERLKFLNSEGYFDDLIVNFSF